MKRAYIAIIVALSIISAASVALAYSLWTQLEASKQSLETAVESLQTQQTENNNLAVQISILQADNKNLRSQADGLKTQLADQIAAAESLSNQNDSLQKQIIDLQNTDGIFYSLTLNDMGDSSSTLVDSLIPNDLLEMLAKHFAAMYNADMTAFKSTLAVPDNEWLAYVKNKKSHTN